MTKTKEYEFVGVMQLKKTLEGHYVGVFLHKEEYFIDNFYWLPE